jgi:hypothetical protein
MTALFPPIHLRPAWIVCSLLAVAPCFPQPESIALPPPRKDGGKPLLRALAERQTIREFSDRTFSPQMLSDLLWAAFGVNRPQIERGGPGRTAPSAMNRQEIDLYVLLPSGVYLYEAAPHRLAFVAPGDLRGKVSLAGAAKAAASILFVADGAKTQSRAPAKATAKAPAGAPTGAPPTYSLVNSGFIGQNIYLFAASEGLGTCFQGGVPDAPALAQTLKLRPEQQVLYAQTVGYPAKP